MVFPTTTHRLCQKQILPLHRIQLELRLLAPQRQGAQRRALHQMKNSQTQELYTYNKNNINTKHILVHNLNPSASSDQFSLRFAGVLVAPNPVPLALPKLNDAIMCASGNVRTI